MNEDEYEDKEINERLSKPPKRKLFIEKRYQPKPEPKKEVEQTEKPKEPELTWSPSDRTGPIAFMGSFAAIKKLLRRPK